jgi:MoxR-like ATPase
MTKPPQSPAPNPAAAAVHGPKDWKIFLGDGSQHDNLAELPQPPPWRFSRTPVALQRPQGLKLDADVARAAPFLPSEPMILAVNAALYLRRPLLITGRPGTGKSTLIAKVAHELKLGPVLRWPITSRSTVRAGLYDYDAVGRLQATRQDYVPPVEGYLTLGPLGTALMATTWPRPLLIDEIDKSDLDFANDLLNVIEDGVFEIPEILRLNQPKVTLRDYYQEGVVVENGRVECRQFPFVVMTSNGEREFPAPFLRRCIRLAIEPPDKTELTRIVQSHLDKYWGKLKQDDVSAIINEFEQRRQEGADLATDQLLNAVFLTIAVRDAAERSFGVQELDALRRDLMRQLSGPDA